MDILIPDISIVEKIARTVIVYAFLLISFRLAGKRQLGEMSPFDLVVLLVVNGAVAWLSSRHRRFQRLVESAPTILVRPA